MGVNCPENLFKIGFCLLFICIYFLFYECENRMWRLGDREIPKNMQLDGGSDWFALHRSLCEYSVSDAQDGVLEKINYWFNYTLLPAESYIHTLLKTSSRCKDLVDNNLQGIFSKKMIDIFFEFESSIDPVFMSHQLEPCARLQMPIQSHRRLVRLQPERFHAVRCGQGLPTKTRRLFRQKI